MSHRQAALHLVLKVQDDLAVLSGGNNGFGYRADEAGTGISSASTNLSLSGTAGVITTTSDWDYYAFSTGAGNVTFSATPPTGGMLDVRLQIVDSWGTTVASASTGDLAERVSAYLNAGTYFIGVGSHGGYGDIGQYYSRGQRYYVN